MTIFKQGLNEAFNDDELERYKRHFSLENIGIKGQKKLKESSVLFIGAGGLGSPAILYIAAAGVGRIGIVDNDKIEKSNLQRQIIHETSEIGKYKTYSAKHKIQKLNPNCIVRTFQKRLNKDNSLGIIKDFDIVCDCTDNFPTRYLVNDSCLLLNKPMIYGSVQGFEGHISVFNLNQGSPNLRDLLPESPFKNNIPSCEEFGVMGISTGLIGVLQANEIIKIITKTGVILNGKILIFNLMSMSMKTLNLVANSKYKQISNLQEYEDFYESTEYLGCKDNIKSVSAKEFKNIFKKNPEQIVIIDVRDENSFKNYSIKGSISVPLKVIQEKASLKYIKDKSAGKKIFTLCKKGISSKNASQILLSQKIESFSIEGGIENLSKDKYFKTENYQ